MALDFVYKEYYYSTTANKNKINNKPGVDESLSPDFSEANIKSNLKKCQEYSIESYLIFYKNIEYPLY